MRERAAPANGMWSRLRGRTEFWLLLVILGFGAVLSAAAPGFVTLSNFVDLLETYSVQAILAMGLFVVLVAGGIDISFAATASVAQYVAAYLAARLHLPAIVCIAAGLSAGVALGCLNATLIHFVRVTSIIATIATMSVYFALLMYATGGKSIYDLPDWWNERIVFYQTETSSGDLLRITLPIVAMAAAVLLTWLLMARSAAGRQLYAMGGSAESARRVGMNIAGLHYLAYGYLGFMAGVAGLIQAHRVGESVPNAMVGENCRCCRPPYWEARASPEARAVSVACCSGSCCWRYCRTVSTCWASRRISFRS